MGKKFEKKSDKLKVELIEYSENKKQCNAIVKIGQGVLIGNILETIQNQCKEKRKEKEYKFYLMENKTNKKNDKIMYEYEKYCFIIKY